MKCPPSVLCCLTAEGLVQLDLPYLVAVRIQGVLQLDLGGVVRVGAELHAAVLPVEGEIRHLGGRAERKALTSSLDREKKAEMLCCRSRTFSPHQNTTGAQVECRWGPGHPAVAVHLDVNMQRHIKHAVVATNQQKKKKHGEDKMCGLC